MIKISFLEHYRECECCGSYRDVELIVSNDDKIIYEGYKDDHFGNGIDVEDAKTVLPEVLKALGYEVESVEEVHDEQ